MIPLDVHHEVAEDGVKRLHPGYFGMQCPACKQPFLIGKPGFGEMRAINGALHCGRKKCAEEMGLGVDFKA